MVDYLTSIIDISYKLKKNKDKNKPGAIVFLGAGASFTAEIPLTGKIIEEISVKFYDKPSIENYFKELTKANIGKEVGEKIKPDYYGLMQRLDADDIKELFIDYVKNAKLNVAHIYLASMIKAGYVDYVVTVNFDNLVQRSLALFDIFPSIHDLTTIKEKVTDTIEIPAVIHAHGQYNGNWQLNKIGELGKVKEMMQNTFAKISQNRTWIVVGYSGEDPVFDTIFSSTKFDKNLYWVCYKEQAPILAVQEKLLNKVEFNACTLKGYDADSFFMKLHNELKIDEPDIYKNPFNVLDKYLSNVKDISGDEFKGVSQRLDIGKKRVKEAITLFNEGNDGNISFTEEYKSTITIDNYALELSTIVSSKNFDKIPQVHKTIRKNNLENELKVNLSDAYFSWGYELGEKGEYETAIVKYETAVSLHKKPDIVHNWATMLYGLKKYKTAIEKYTEAIGLNNNDSLYYRNRGLAYYANDEYKNANLDFESSIKFDPTFTEVYYDYANSLAKTENFTDALGFYKKTIELNPVFALAYSGMGHCLNKLGKLDESIIQLQKGEVLQEGSCLYNLICGYALSGQKELSLACLEKLLKNEIAYKEPVTRIELENDPDLLSIRQLPAFVQLLDKYKPIKAD